jgi:hypothetical protein
VKSSSVAARPLPWDADHWSWFLLLAARGFRVCDGHVSAFSPHRLAIGVAVSGIDRLRRDSREVMRLACRAAEES